jgi:hypothetical protein
MPPDQVPPERDLEFRPSPNLLYGGGVGRVEDYMRLVANPFLGIFGIVVWCAVMYLFLRIDSFVAIPLLALWSIGGVRFLPALFHYHCRDCGSSGPLFHWRQHTCPAILDRIRVGRPRRLRGPTPVTQVVLWFYILVGFVIFITSAGWPLRSLFR